MSERRTFKVATRGIGRQDYSQNVERYDAEPTLLLLEGFESLPPSWEGRGSAGVVPYSVARETARVWRGGACLNLMTGSELAPVDNYAGYNQFFGMVGSLKLLADVHFTVPAANGTYFYWAIHRRSITNYITFAVRYDIANEVWQYYDAPGVWINIQNGAQQLARTDADTIVFHHLWLAGDFQSLEYLYLQCNENMMTLKGLMPAIRAPVGLPSSEIEFNARSGGNANVDYYIDNARVAEVF